jgi:hypothetical protein
LEQWSSSVIIIVIIDEFQEVFEHILCNPSPQGAFVTGEMFHMARQTEMAVRKTIYNSGYL